MKTKIAFGIILLLLMHYCPSIKAQSPEKIQLTLDKPFYASGDEINVDVKVFDGQNFQFTDLSVPLYIEWIEPNQATILRSWVIQLQEGRAALKIQTAPKTQSGIYLIRAYTNWMKNWEIPATEVTIIHPNYRQTMQIQAPDTLINFGLESAQLVSGLQNRIAIKLSDQFKNPIKAPLGIVNQRNETLASSVTNAAGLAMLTFTPATDSLYFIKVGTQSKPLPVPENSGISMLINNTKNAGINVFFNTTNDWTFNGETLQLSIKLRGEEVEKVPVNPSTKQRYTIDKQNWQEGIYTFELCDKAGDIITKRNIFIAEESGFGPYRKWLLDNELQEDFDTYSNNEIDAALLLTNNKLFVDKPDIRFKNEKSLVINGVVENPSAKKNISVTLVAKPFLDSLNTTFRTTPMQADGTFYFDDLVLNEAHNTIRINALDQKNKRYKVKVIAPTSPPIKKEALNIDWRKFNNDSTQQLITQFSVSGTEMRKTGTDTYELPELSIITKKSELKSSVDFKGEPVQVFDFTKKVVPANYFPIFFESGIYWRLKKYWLVPYEKLISFYLDGFRIPNDQLDETFNFSAVKAVKVYEGSEASLHGTYIVVHFLTSGSLYANPYTDEYIYYNDDFAGFDKSPLYLE